MKKIFLFLPILFLLACEQGDDKYKVIQGDKTYHNVSVIRGADGCSIILHLHKQIAFICGTYSIENEE